MQKERDQTYLPEGQGSQPLGSDVPARAGSFAGSVDGDAADKEKTLRAIVAQVAMREDGNFNLRLGRFITQADKDRLRAQVMAYEIKAPI